MRSLAVNTIQIGFRIRASRSQTIAGSKTAKLSVAQRLICCGYMTSFEQPAVFAPPYAPVLPESDGVCILMLEFQVLFGPQSARLITTPDLAWKVVARPEQEAGVISTVKYGFVCSQAGT